MGKKNIWKLTHRCNDYTVEIIFCVNFKRERFLLKFEYGKRFKQFKCITLARNIPKWAHVYDPNVKTNLDLREREKSIYLLMLKPNNRTNHVIWWNMLRLHSIEWILFYCIIASTYCHVYAQTTTTNTCKHLMQWENDSVSFHMLLCWQLWAKDKYTNKHTHVRRKWEWRNIG